jgi:transcriptional regulator with XRE-family HTH domain
MDGKSKKDMSLNCFGNRLRELRNNADLTQTQLAERAGIARSFVAKMEAGQHIPSWDTVQAIAKALGVNCMAFQDDGQVEPKKPKPKKKKP